MHVMINTGGYRVKAQLYLMFWLFLFSWLSVLIIRPALCSDLLVWFSSHYMRVLLSTISGPCLDQDVRARTLISAGSLALGFANPFAPWASSFCFLFLFCFLSTGLFQSGAEAGTKVFFGRASMSYTSWDGLDAGPLLSQWAVGASQRLGRLKKRISPAAEQACCFSDWSAA